MTVVINYKLQIGLYAKGYKGLSVQRLRGGFMFNLKSNFVPTGDQPEAIKKLSEGILEGEKNQILLGVTGSGKTFTIANVIKETGRPALIMAPNKTLAAQLYGEYKKFFPDNAVEYFVSYYDYYQPEALKTKNAKKYKKILLYK